MKIALVLNSRVDTSEFQVEYDPPHTIAMIKHGIEQAGYEYHFIEADNDAFEKLRSLQPDLVFNRAEGRTGGSRESHIPAVLEMLEIPYVGSGVLTLAVCLNKAWTKKVLNFHGIPTPAFELAELGEHAVDVPFPAILKPNEEGSSVGINEDNVVRDSNQMKVKLSELFERYQEPILVEQFISGREISVGVLGTSMGSFEILPLLEVNFSKLPPNVEGVFGQRAKVTYDDLENYDCPAELDLALENTIVETTLEICHVLEIRDFARLDFRISSSGTPYFLEINPLPGMDFNVDERDFSFYPLMAKRAGYGYSELVRRLIESAASRYPALRELT